MKLYRVSAVIILLILTTMIFGCSNVKISTSNIIKTTTNQTTTTSQETIPTNPVTTTTEDNPISDSELMNTAFSNLNNSLNYMMHMHMEMTKSNKSISVDLDVNSGLNDSNSGDMEMVLDTTTSGQTSEQKNYFTFNEEGITQYTNYLNLGWIENQISNDDFQNKTIDISNEITEYSNLLYIKDDLLKDGTLVKVYDITINSSDIIKMIFDQANLYDDLGINKQKVENLTDNLKIKIYIDSNKKVIRKMDYNMSEIFAKLTSSEISQMKVSVDLSQYDDVSVSIPSGHVLDYVQYDGSKINLDFRIKDVAIHINQPIIYAISEDKKLYTINYETNEIKTVSFEFNPQCIYYRDGLIYVAFTKHDFSRYISNDEQAGKVIILNSDDLSIESQFNVQIDPFDMVVDHEGYIYITSGSGQNDAPIDCYNNIGIRMSRGNIEPKSYATIDDTNSTIYTVDSEKIPRSMESYNYLTGRLLTSTELPYHGTYDLTTKISVSPDGTYLFNGEGNVFSCSSGTDDMIYRKSLPMSFSDIAYDVNDNDTIYAAGDNFIVAYNYQTFNAQKVYSLSDTVAHVYMNLNQLIAVGDNYIQVIDEGKPKLETPVDDIPEQSSPFDDFKDVQLKNYESEQVSLPFNYTNMVVDPSKPLILATNSDTKEVYSFNYETKELSTLSFDLTPDNLYYRDGYLYVTLLKGEHAYYDSTIAIINVDMMLLVKQFDINIYPYSIIVDNDGYIYISGVSNYWTSVNSYNDMGMKIDSVRTYMNGTLLQYDYVNNYLYVQENGEQTRYVLDNGEFTNQTSIDGTVRQILYNSPDGQKIYDGSTGDILNASTHQKIQTLDFTFKDIAFDESNNHYYIVNSNGIFMYNYTTNKLLAFYPLDLPIIKLYNNDHHLIGLSCQNDQYSIIIIHQDDSLNSTKNQDDYAQNNQSSLTELSYDRNTTFLNHTVTDAVLDPSQPILYMVSSADQKLYVYNYVTGEEKTIEFAYPINKIKFYNNQLYIALDNGPINDVEGYIDLIDQSNYSIISQIPLNVEPLDFAFNGNYLYVESHDNFKDVLTSYDLFGNQIDRISNLEIYSLLLDNVANNQIIAAGYQDSQEGLYRILLDNGVFNNVSFSEKHIDVYNLYASPDRTYLFDGNKTIFDMSNFSDVDSLDYSFNYLSFNKQTIYGLDYQNRIYAYDTTSHDLTGFGILNDEPVSFFFARNDNVITITKDNYQYKINIYKRTNSTPIINEPAPEASDPQTIYFNGDKINYDFLLTNAIKDPNQPIFYLISSANKKLYSINYETKEIKDISFDLIPENLTIKDNLIYVTLLKGQHNSQWFIDNQEGAVAVIDKTTMIKINQFDVQIDPYDIAADKNGYIYISSGSGQWTSLNSYDPETFEEIDTVKVYQQATIEINQKSNQLYVDDIEITSYYLQNGHFIQGNLFDNNTKMFKLSPDGKYIFDYDGNIYYSSAGKEDLVLKGKLDSGFDEIAFDLTHNLFYVARGKEIDVYSYSNMKELSKAEMLNPINQLFYDGENLITFSTGVVNYIQILQQTTTDEQIPPEPVTPAEVFYDENNQLLSHSVSDSVMNPTKPVIYMTSLTNETLYSYNIDTNETKSLKFDYPVHLVRFANGKIYVTLDNLPSNVEDNPGFIAIIDPETLTVEKMFATNIISYDMVVDAKGYIYVSPSDTSEFKYLECYDSLGNLMSQTGIRENSPLQILPSNERVSSIETGLSSVTLYAFNFKDGVLTDSYRLYGGHDNQTYFDISPDGKFYFLNSGDINYVSFLQSEDGLNHYKLSSPYQVIDFDLEHNQFYTAMDSNIYLYDYTTYNLLEKATITGSIQYLCHYNNQLIVITKDSNNNYTLKILTQTDNPHENPPVTQEPVVLTAQKETLTLPSNYTHIIKDPENPIFYYTDYYNHKVYSYNYATNELKSITFNNNLLPENLIYKNHKIYVTLSNHPHDFVWFIYYQTGAIAVIDSDTFTLLDQFDVNIDPYNIAVDDGYIYITSGSGQWTELQSYNLSDYSKGDSLRVYQKADLEINSFDHRLYFNSSTLSSVFIDDGSHYGYTNLYWNTFDSLSIITPDGKYIIDNNGIILSSSISNQEDLLLKGNLNISIDSITFDLDNNLFYISSGNTIYQYNYLDFTLLGTYQTNQSYDSLYYNGSELIGIYGNKVDKITFDE